MPYVGIAKWTESHPQALFGNWLMPYVGIAHHGLVEPGAEFGVQVIIGMRSFIPFVVGGA